jgi:hypothetical protein
MGASGDTRELTIDHPSLGSRSFGVQADQSITLDLGGFSSERQNNGNGSGHKKMTAKMWEIAGLQIDCNLSDGDLEFLQAIQNNPDDATITWDHITGVVYRGKGSIEGDLKLDTNTGYVATTLTGNGKLEAVA